MAVFSFRSLFVQDFSVHSLLCCFLQNVMVHDPRVFVSFCSLLGHGTSFNFDNTYMYKFLLVRPLRLP